MSIRLERKPAQAEFAKSIFKNGPSGPLFSYGGEMNPDEFIKKTRRSSCPKCGGGNNCALETGKSISACWCISQIFPEGIDVSGESCYCRRCVNELRINNESTEA